MTTTTLERHFDIASEVEAEWGRQMQGELGLNEDDALHKLVLDMADYILEQRRMTNADAHGAECEPLAKQIVYAVQMLTSPEMNGA